MTLASTKNNFLRAHGNPDLIDNVRFGHSVPITMHVDVYDVLIAEETLPTYFDFPVVFKYVDKPADLEDGTKVVPKWFSDFEKLDKGKVTADPTLGEKARIVFTADDY